MVLLIQVCIVNDAVTTDVVTNSAACSTVTSPVGGVSISLVCYL